MTIAPSRQRLLQLAKLSCSIFSTTFNPTAARTGNKFLRQRLKGQTLLGYYPKREVTIKDLRKAWPEMYFPDEEEDQRIISVEKAKARGKGAPKKIRTKPAPKGKK